jgi:hypothetical protein
MTLTIDIKPKLQAEFARQAAAQGVGIDAYAARLLEEAAHLPGAKGLSPAQLENALQEIARFSQKIPSLPDDAFSRASLYRDHDWCPGSCLLDSNILLRMTKNDDPHYAVVSAALQELVTQGTRLCFTSQTLGEFWNASTRPLDQNGFGLSTQETDATARVFDRAGFYVSAR